jgi:hypothetical protein
MDLSPFLHLSNTFAPTTDRTLKASLMKSIHSVFLEGNPAIEIKLTHSFSKIFPIIWNYGNLF